jgi:N-acetylglucosaminyl-diphospho-decaprenol L-rhamnosyltransferase
MVGPITLIIIVNYRTASLTIDALASLAPEIAGHPGSRCFVIDNGSADGSTEAITDAVCRSGYGGWCQVEALPDNAGFSAGNNAALALADKQGFTPDLVWLLNPDTLLRPHALDALVAFMANHPNAGIVGGGTEHPDRTRQYCAFRFPTPLGEIEAAIGLGLARRLLGRHVIAPPYSDHAVPIDWVSGASMMVRRETFDRVGRFDERYFLYYEETDFCRRAADAGIACWHEPASRVVHLIGQSTGMAGAARRLKRRPRYWFDSRALYYRRHLGLPALVAANVGWLMAYLIGYLLDRLRGRPVEETPWLWFDMLRFGWGPKNPRRYGED